MPFDPRSVFYTVFGAAFTIATAWSLGTLALRRLRASLYCLEDTLLAFLAGSVILSGVVWALCAFGLARKSILLEIGFPLIALAVWSAVLSPNSVRFPALSPRVLVGLAVGFAGATALYLFAAIPQQATPDILTYQLSLIGRNFGFTGAGVGGVPDAFELFFLHAFITSRYAAVLLVNLALVMATALLVFCGGRRLAYPRVGMAAALLTLAAQVPGFHASFVNSHIRQWVLLFVLLYLLWVAVPFLKILNLARATALFGLRRTRVSGIHLFSLARGSATGSLVVIEKIELALSPFTVLICATGILIYFCHFAISGLSAQFTSDDLMNLDYYWARGAKGLAFGLVGLPSTFYRPMGGVFYLLIYQFAGLHAEPYHLIAFLLLIVNVFLAYRFGALLSGSKAVGGFTALFVSYQAGIGDVTCNTGVIYDILCFTFYFAAFVYYLRARVALQFVSGWKLGIFLALYAAALDSKEMAVSLPVMVLAYELIYHPPDARAWRGVFRWLTKEGRAALSAGVLTAIFIAGRLSGPDPLTANQAYRPVITAHNFVDSLSRLLSDLFFVNPFNIQSAALTLIFLGLAALVSKVPALRYCYLHVLVSMLPIAFLPARAGSCYYIVLPGIAVAVAVILWRGLLFLDCLSLARPLIIVIKTSALMFVVAGCLRFHDRNKQYVQSWIGPDAARISSVLTEVHRENPRVPRGGSVAFLGDPFEDWQMAFITHLWFDDHTLKIWLTRKTPLTAAELASMDVLYIFEGSTLKRLR